MIKLYITVKGSIIFSTSKESHIAPAYSKCIKTFKDKNEAVLYLIGLKHKTQEVIELLEKKD